MTGDGAPRGLADGERLETGVYNLDRALGGGILRGAIVAVIGVPGTGKTILAQQVAFRVAAGGSSALYLTGYSETHDKLLAYGRGLRFFRPDLVGGPVQYMSVADLLRTGAAETEAAILETARAARARLVVLDGFGSMRRLLGDELATAEFLYSLGAKLALLGATTLVASEADPDGHERYAELTISDVIIGLRRRHHGDRSRRTLEVIKVRGAAGLDGLHAMTIDAAGIRVHPRLEAIVARGEPAWTGGRAGFDLPELDALLGGGLTVGTTTLAAGGPGVGKTLLGLHYAAAGARAGEPSLFAGFMESGAQLRAKARTFGLDLEAAERAGRLALLTLPGHDVDADVFADRLRERVESLGIRRLVIDSALELDRGIVDRERATGFLAALVAYVRGRDVTAYLTLDVPKIVGPDLDLAGTPLSVVAENLLLLRHVEYRGRLLRLISALKMRFSDHDRAIRAYEIAAGRGIRLLGEAPPGEALLTGVARPPAADPSPTARRRR